MRPSRVFLAVLLAVTALLLQLTALNRLTLPRAHPSLVVVVVVSVALVEGPLVGAGLGFGTGLLADLLGDHLLGRFALLLTLVGYAAGLAQGEEERSTALPVLAVGAASAGVVLLDAGLGVLLGDPHLGAGRVAVSAVVTAGYDVLLTPFVFPAVRGLFHRLDPERR